MVAEAEVETDGGGEDVLVQLEVSEIRVDDVVKNALCVAGSEERDAEGWSLDGVAEDELTEEAVALGHVVKGCLRGDVMGLAQHGQQRSSLRLVEARLLRKLKLSKTLIILLLLLYLLLLKTLIQGVMGKYFGEGSQPLKQGV